MLRISQVSLAMLLMSGLALAQQSPTQQAVQPTPGQPAQNPNVTPGQPNANANANAAGRANANANARFGGINQQPWFGDPGVRRQLNLNDQQFNTMNSRYGELYGQYRNDLNSLRQQNLPANELRQRTRDLEQRFNREFASGYNDYFPDAANRNRYQQLYWQYQGTGAFSDPQLQQRLNLNEEQQSRISDLENNWNTQMQRWSNLPENQRTDESFREMQSRRSKQLQEILNEQQLREWNSLTGDPYDFPSSVYFSNSTQTGTRATGTRANDDSPSSNSVNPQR